MKEVSQGVQHILADTISKDPKTVENLKSWLELSTVDNMT